MCVWVSGLQGTDSREEQFHILLLCVRHVRFKGKCSAAVSNAQKCAKPEQWYKYSAEIKRAPQPGCEKDEKSTAVTDDNVSSVSMKKRPTCSS